MNKSFQISSNSTTQTEMELHHHHHQQQQQQSLNSVKVKEEIDDDDDGNVQMASTLPESTTSQHLQHSSCTVIKKEEEVGEFKVELDEDDDYCDCTDCDENFCDNNESEIKQEFKSEFYQASGTEVANYTGLTSASKGGQVMGPPCKRLFRANQQVKMEEEGGQSAEIKIELLEGQFEVKLENVQIKEEQMELVCSDGGEGVALDHEEDGSEVRDEESDGQRTEKYENVLENDGDLIGEFDEEFGGLIETREQGDSEDQEGTQDRVNSDNGVVASNGNETEMGEVVERQSEQGQLSRKMEHKCEHCGKSFTRASDCKTHIRIHTKEKPFICKWPDCNNTYARSHHLKDHIRTHTGDKPYKCSWDNCNQAFAQNSHLICHIRTHTGDKKYKCTLANCNKAFAKNSGLTEHLRTHTGDKPYKCSWVNCNKAFAKNSNIKSHLKTHTDEKPFRCPWKDCFKQFSKNNNMRVHLLTHTREK